MNKNILLTIGIPNYNYTSYITETIQSAIQQKGDDIEIMNSCADNSNLLSMCCFPKHYQ